MLNLDTLAEPSGVPCVAPLNCGGEASGMPIESDEFSRWQMQADEARALAAGMTDPASKRTMLEISACYERLAHRAEKRDPQKCNTIIPTIARWER